MHSQYHRSNSSFDHDDGILRTRGSVGHSGTKEQTPASDYLQRGHLDKSPSSCPTVTLTEFYNRTDFSSHDDVMPSRDIDIGTGTLSGYMGVFFKWLNLLGLHPFNNAKWALAYTYVALVILIASAVVTTWLTLEFYGKVCGLTSVISSFRTIASYGSTCVSYVFGFWYLRQSHFSQQMQGLTTRDTMSLNKVVKANFVLLFVMMVVAIAFLLLSTYLGPKPKDAGRSTNEDSPLVSDNPWATAAQFIGVIFGASGLVAVLNIFGIVCTIARIHIWRYRIYAINAIIAASRALSSILREEEAAYAAEFNEDKGARSASNEEKSSGRISGSGSINGSGNAEYGHGHNNNRPRGRSTSNPRFHSPYFGGRSGDSVGAGGDGEAGVHNMSLPGDVTMLLAIQNRLHTLLLLRYRKLCRRIQRVKNYWMLWISGVSAVALIFFLVVSFSLYEWVSNPAKYTNPNPYTVGIWVVFGIAMPGYLLYHIARVNGDNDNINHVLTSFSLDLEQTFRDIGAPEVPWLAFNDRVSFLQIFTGQFRQTLLADMANIRVDLSVLGVSVSMNTLRTTIWAVFLFVLPLAIQIFFGVQNRKCAMG